MFTPESVVKGMLELAWQGLLLLATHTLITVLCLACYPKIALPSFKSIYGDLAWSKANNIMNDVRYPLATLFKLLLIVLRHFLPLFTQSRSRLTFIPHKIITSEYEQHIRHPVFMAKITPRIRTYVFCLTVFI